MMDDNEFGSLNISSLLGETSAEKSKVKNDIGAF